MTMMYLEQENEIEKDNNSGILLDALCAVFKEKISEGSYQESEALLVEAMQQFPESAVPHNLFGILLERERKHPQAMKHFRAAYALEPSYEPARRNLEIYGGMDALGREAYSAGDCIKKPARLLTKFNVILMRMQKTLIPI